MAAPAAAAGFLGRNIGQPLWNLARRMYAQGPWERQVMRPATRGMGKKPVYTLDKAGKVVPKVETMRKGLVARHPLTAGLGLHGGAAAMALPWMFSGGDDEQAAQLAFNESGIQQWQPPVGIGSYAEYEAEEGKKIARVMKKALQQYMVISFTAGEGPAKNYLEMVDKIIEQGQGTRQKTRDAKIYDAVFGDKDNLPKSSEEVYNRITLAGGSPQYAAEISGYVGEAKKADVAATGRIGQDRQVIEEIRKIYAVDKDLGARRLVEAWRSGLLKPLPIGDYETLTQTAHETLSGVAAGELADFDMVTGIRVKA